MHGLYCHGDAAFRPAERLAGTPGCPAVVPMNGLVGDVALIRKGTRESIEFGDNQSVPGSEDSLGITAMTNELVNYDLLMV